MLEEELRGYGVDARADRLTSSQLRAAKSAIKAKRKQHPKVQLIHATLMTQLHRKRETKETTSTVFFTYFKRIFVVANFFRNIKTTFATLHP